MGVEFKKDRLGFVVDEKEAINSPLRQVTLRNNHQSVGAQVSFHLFFSELVTQVGVFRAGRTGVRLGNVFSSFLFDILASELAELVINLIYRWAIYDHTEIGVERGRCIRVHRKSFINFVVGYAPNVN